MASTVEMQQLPTQARLSVPGQGLPGGMAAVMSAVGLAMVLVLTLLAALAVWRRRDADRLAAAANAALRVRLADADRHLAVAIQGLEGGFIAADGLGRVILMNRRAEQLSGWTQAEALGRNLWQVFQHVDADPVDDDSSPLQRLIEQEATPSEPRIVVGRARDGSSRPLEVRVDLSRRPDGGLHGIVLLLRDLSRPHAWEVDRQRLAAIVESSSDAIIGKTLSGVITSWNRAAELLFGYRADQAVGRPVQMLIPPERADEEMRILSLLAQGQKVAPFETVRLAQDGRRLAVSISISPIRDASGRVVGAAKIARDMSAHRQVESQLRESRAVLDGALRDNDSLLRTIHTHFIVSIADAGGLITEVNESFCRISGYARDELVGQNHRIINSGVQDAAFWVSMWTTIAAGRPWRGEICNRAKDGSLYWVDSVISPFLGADGRVQKYISIRTDITEAKRAEGARLRAERLEAENRQIQEANRLKSLFLANMSHELRTPLNAVIGFADLLHSGTVDPASPKHTVFLGHIASSGRHLLQLINDVLDLSKVESGKLEFFAEPVDLKQVVADVVSVLAQAWERKSIALEVDIDPTLGVLQLDPARLRQALFNYLSNAIKFTPQGGRVSVRARGEGPLYFRLEVQDSGPGIAAADLPRLFVEFQQLDSGYSKRHPGTGLGLALTRRLVRAQGGNVGVRSSPGAGSVFHLVLPRHPPNGEAGRSHLLMIEASARVQARLGEPLSQAGFHVDIASDGARAASLAQHRPYDAITLDLLMPHPGGLDALPDIRDHGPSSGTPIVAVTLSDGGREAAFAIADLLAKPINASEVVAAMARLRQAGQGPRQVLVIDDDPLAGDLMRVTLEAMGIGVVTAVGGREALAQLAELGRQLPDAIVLDLMMPGMDGFEVLRTLQQHPRWSCLPVFIWTSLILTADEQVTLARSARAVLAKGDGELDAVLESLRRWQPTPVLSRHAELP